MNGIEKSMSGIARVSICVNGIVYMCFSDIDRKMCGNLFISPFSVCASLYMNILWKKKKRDHG